MPSDKDISTLVEDIYAVMKSGSEVTEAQATAFGASVAKVVAEKLSPDGRKVGTYLRPSNIGEKCDRKLWFSVNRPEAGEPLDGPTYLKFLIGDLWEAVLLFLAELSGHSVTGQQDEITVAGVTGHRDGVIDGVLVDAKSAAPYSFDKFASHLTPDVDAFGYIPQINFYLEGSKDDPLVRRKDFAAFLVGDKTHGKLTLDFHTKAGFDYPAIVQAKTEMLVRTKMPSRGYQDEDFGKSGNRKLGINCSYCQFKHSCWPGLRTFLYSTGPVYLTEVTREPNVYEVKDD
jgi:hypothetical protein